MVRVLCVVLLECAKVDAFVTGDRLYSYRQCSPAVRSQVVRPNWTRSAHLRAWPLCSGIYIYIDGWCVSVCEEISLWLKIH